MGWINEPKHNAGRIVHDVIKNIGEWKGVPKGNSSAYEFFTDYIRDNYDVTLAQCKGICDTLRAYYNIKNFYYGELCE